jgi:CBS domain containing-hemolysin-like protein
VEGVLTLEDLIETLLGVEIVDEADQIADLRELAQQLRQQRLERLRSSLPPPVRP